MSETRSLSSYGYTQATALVYSSHGEPRDKLRLHRYSISPPTSTNITLRMLAAPINPADVNQIQGTYPSRPEFSTGLGTPEPSAVGGNEGVAEVIGVGSAVDTVTKGDWVVMKTTGMGTWRTHMSVDQGKVIRVDKTGLTPLQAGTVSVNPITAYRMLRDFVSWSFRGDEWFIQNGANSGVGRAAIQLGKQWGIKSVNVVRERPGWEELREELISLGATHVVTETEMMGAGFAEKIKEWTNGGREGVRLGLNCVGGKPATALAKLLSEDGHMVTYGAMSRQPTVLPTGLLIFKNIAFSGFWVSKWGNAHTREKQQTIEEVLDMIRQGKLVDVPVDEVRWDADTKSEALTAQVQGTLEGFRKGKGVFVFGE